MSLTNQALVADSDGIRWRYFRLHTEKHSVIISFLLSISIWQPVKNFP